MKNILILTSKYIPNPSANGINTKYICDELVRRAYKVTCVTVIQEGESEYEIIDDVEIYRITPSAFMQVIQKKNKGNIIDNLLFKLKRRINNLLLLSKFPNFDTDQFNKTYKFISTLNTLHNYDCVIGIHKPYSNIAALRKLKKENPNIIAIGYYLDLVNSMRRPEVMSKKLYNMLVNKEARESLQVLDALLIPVGGRSLYSNTGMATKEKIIYIDFPTFITNISEGNFSSKSNKNNELSMVYAGTLNKIYRNPEKLICILNEVSNSVGTIKLHIFGKNDCEDLFMKYTSNPSFQIINHGPKSHVTVLNAMQSSDFLINISNKMQDAVPSKIFELFSMGKPIINFVFDKNDITSDYFHKYNFACSINNWENDNKQIDSLSKFIDQNLDVSIDINKIQSMFIMNTPEYTVDRIEEIIKRKIK